MPSPRTRLGPSEGRSLDDRIRADDRRIVVLDDDPTGTQTVSDVDVVLQPTTERIESFFRSSDRALYVITNTRAMIRDEATAHLRRLCASIDQAAGVAGVHWVPILRGDSTLRGHVFAEADAIRLDRSIILFVPAFPEGGRTTVHGSQFIEIDGRYVNAADTEFARDPVFGYRSRDLVDWVAETGSGRHASMVPLADLHSMGPAAVTAAIAAASPGSVVIPEAVVIDDLRLIAMGLLDAEQSGHAVVVRSASSFAAIRCGLRPRDLGRGQVPASKRLLVACGSYTAASTAQLEALEGRGIAVEYLPPGSPDGTVEGRLRGHLDHSGLAVVATPRQRTDDGSLGSGAAMMERLAGLVGRLGPDVDAVIAKGGITAADLAIALGAGIARVEGQVAPGIALWTLQLDGGRTMPYAVVPGNVGAPGTIVDLVALFRAGDSAAST